MAADSSGLRLRAPAGDGALGPRWLAEPAGSPGRLVLAELVAGPLDDARFAGLERAWSALREVEHPGLLVPRAVVRDGDGAAILMPPMAGGSLEALLVRLGGAVPEAHVLDTAEALTAALAAIHGRGVVHGGLDARCVLLDGAGRPRLAPLGPAAVGAPDRDAGGLAEVARQDVRALAGVLLAAIGAGRQERHGSARSGVPIRPASRRSRTPNPGEPAADLVSAERSDPPEAHGQDPAGARLAEVLARVVRQETPADAAALHGEVRSLATSLTGGTERTPGRRGHAHVTSVGRRAGRTLAAAIVAVAVITTGTGVVAATVRSSGSSERAASPTTPTPATDPAAEETSPGEQQIFPGGVDDGPGTGAGSAVARVAPPPCDGVAAPVGADGGEVVLADLAGRGCSVPVRRDGRRLVVPEPDGSVQRFDLAAEPDDVLLAGDWSCDGRDGLALYRPGTGEVFRFDGLAAPGEEVRASAEAAGGPGGVPTVVVDADGCATVVVGRPEPVGE